MKKAILFLLQFVLFLFAIALGSFARPFHLQTTFGRTGLVSHTFVWDGLLLALALFALLLLAEFLAKRLRSLGPWTTGAFVLAAIAGLALKLGFITRDL